MALTRHSCSGAGRSSHHRGCFNLVFCFNVPSVVVVTLAPLDIALKSAYTAPNVDTRMLVTTWDMLPERTYHMGYFHSPTYNSIRKYH